MSIVCFRLGAADQDIVARPALAAVALLAAVERVVAGLPLEAVTAVLAVKKAEKVLDLTVDGYLTPDEQAVILKQYASKPDKVKKLTAKASNGVVSLSWSSVKGAYFYDLYRDSEKIATVTGTSYKDKNVDMAQYYTYAIVACNYSESSVITPSNMVYVDIV
jgi:hypothetical protein